VEQQPLSANVLLRPAGGGSVADVARAETAEQLTPDPALAARAEEYFRNAGFDVTASVGPSFSIVGSRELFEHTFAQRLEGDERGIRTAEGSYELSLDPLPRDLADAIEAVTFTPPPDFGPTDY
jgi:hypothetical protein